MVNVCTWLTFKRSFTVLFTEMLEFGRRKIFRHDCSKFQPFVKLEMYILIHTDLTSYLSPMDSFWAMWNRLFPTKMKKATLYVTFLCFLAYSTQIHFIAFYLKLLQTTGIVKNRCMIRIFVFITSWKFSRMIRSSDFPHETRVRISQLVKEEGEKHGR